jgi:hypothetical protein
MAADVGVLLVIALLFFTYFSSITTSEYKGALKGDAAIYTLMTLHLGSPNKVEQTLPVIYSQRIVPPLITYLVGYRQFSSLGESADHITTEQGVKSTAGAPLSQMVWRYWNRSNFIAYSLQLLFLYLMLAHLKVERKVGFFMLAIYSTWFLSIRLYTDWVQMPDPWAFTFLCIAAYCTLKRNTTGFILSIVLGSLCKEILLFMLPTYIWRKATAGDNLGVRIAACTAAAVVPLVLFFWLRAHPHFASEVLTPNSLNAPEAPWWGTLAPRFSDYLYILYYHYSYRLKLGPLYLLDLLLIPVGTFAGLSALLIWSAKETARTLKEHAYWLPFLLLTIVVGINVDRYIFYTFPVVILVSAQVLLRRFSGKELVYALCLITAVSVLSNELLRPFGTEFLSYRHQLELASTMSPEWAWSYRFRVIETTIVGVAGLYLIGRLRAKRDASTKKYAEDI